MIAKEATYGTSRYYEAGPYAGEPTRSALQAARPYRWWEFEPTPPEAPEVARRRGEPGFWVGFGADVRNGIGFLLLSLVAAGLFKLFLIE